MSETEAARLHALRALAVLDTPPEARFDRLTTLAAALFDAPIALVSLIDHDRQWFKSRVGLEVTQTPRSIAFCDYAIQGEPGSTLLVEDATLDPRFADNPLVTGPPHVRFYVGAVLTTTCGQNIGTLCVIDHRPRKTPTRSDLDCLAILAGMVVGELELANASRAVAEQGRLLELAEAMSGVGHWRYRMVDGRITWSEEVYRIHGVDPSSFDPNLDQGLAFFHADDRAHVADLVARAVAHGEDYAFMARLVRPDGAVRHVSCKAACEFDANGATTALVGVFQDVTDQVATLKAVGDSAARYRLLTENANDLVTEMDTAGRFSYVSPSIRTVTGYDPAEVIGKVALHFIHADDRERVSAAFAAALHGPSGWQIEYRVVCKDGRVIWVEARPSLAHDPVSGEVAGVTDVIRDITDRKQLELELERARAKAEAAAAVKSDFLANMSHELRTPLTSILGFTDLLRGRPGLDAEAQSYVQRVNHASGALLTIVNDILDFSKLEAGQVEIDPQPADPKALMTATLGLMTPQAAAKGLWLEMDSAGLPPALLMDDARVRQILLNLIGNAVKFTQAGGVCVKARYNKAKGVLRCEVTDTGPGVPADRLDRLFKRFSQVDASTTRSYGGTGLGLAICKGLAEAMGGAVGASSVVGQGSTFWLELPCPVAITPTQAAAKALDCTGALHGLRVLVADDNAINRELVRIILTPFGVEVFDAADGREAVRWAEASPFDVILMDIRMPNLDGPAAAEAIRQGGGVNATAPIIAFTAGGPGDLAQTFDAELGKPLIAAELLSAVSDASRRRPKRETPAGGAAPALGH